MFRDTVTIDPSIVMFTHSRIRPVFTGCGGRIEDTLLDIMEKRVKIEDIPLMTVVENEGVFYSMNNRRLFVMKQLRLQGLLVDNSIQVYIKPALEREKKKYTPANCVMDAKIMIEHTWDTAESTEATTTESSTITPPPVTILRSQAVPLTLRNCKIDDSILKSLKDLKKLLEKKKHKAVASQIDEWVMNGMLNEPQLAFVNSELGL